MFDPRHYLAFSKQTRLLPQSEAIDRAAISRAYYAAFLVSREHIRQKRIVARPPAGQRWGSHETVIHAVGLISARGAWGSQKRLFRLKKLRTRADYDLDYGFEDRDVERAIHDAEVIIAWIDGLP